MALALQPDVRGTQHAGETASMYDSAEGIPTPWELARQGILLLEKVTCTAKMVPFWWGQVILGIVEVGASGS